MDCDSVIVQYIRLCPPPRLSPEHFRSRIQPVSYHGCLGCLSAAVPLPALTQTASDDSCSSAAAFSYQYNILWVTCSDLCRLTL